MTIALSSSSNRNSDNFELTTASIGTIRNVVDHATYSVIIPAFNEEYWLSISVPAAKEAMSAVSMPGELIVVDNNSMDATASVAKTLGARVVFESVNQISRARNAGAESAGGAYLVFVDADTLLTQALLQRALDSLAADTCCGGGALVSMDGGAETGIAKRMFMSVVRLGQLLRFAAGCFMFCRADAFVDIGGFSERIFATEEFWFALKLKKWGRMKQKPFELLEDVTVVTSSRKFDDPYSLLKMLMVVLIPFSIFFRSMCRFWYKRTDFSAAVNDTDPGG
jgi:glycosyltransferase involved in cell wall biosynthesis